MARIAVGTIATAIVGAVAVFLFNMPQSTANAARTEQAIDMAAPVPAAAGTSARLDLAQAASQPASPLPGGASALRETFEDWQVVCSVTNAIRNCALAQQQQQRSTNQLVLAAEFGPTQDDGSVAGRLVLPFGLLMSAGVTLQIDDLPVSGAYPFRTCLSVGCIVPLTLDAGMVVDARAGAVLTIMATASETSQSVRLAVSLAGFAAALDRIRMLSAN